MVVLCRVAGALRTFPPAAVDTVPAEAAIRKERFRSTRVRLAGYATDVTLNLLLLRFATRGASSCMKRQVWASHDPSQPLKRQTLRWRAGGGTE
jgi:hypothetical protein